MAEYQPGSLPIYNRMVEFRFFSDDVAQCSEGLRYWNYMYGSLATHWCKSGVQSLCCDPILTSYLNRDKSSQYKAREAYIHNGYIIIIIRNRMHIVMSYQQSQVFLK